VSSFDHSFCHRSLVIFGGDVATLPGVAQHWQVMHYEQNIHTDLRREA